MRDALESLVAGKDLSLEQASAAMTDIMEGRATPAQLGAFLTALRIKGETSEEMAGMARVMQDKALRVPVDADGVIDTCGTGGDSRFTVNISTAAALICAACGLRVAKHGNRSATSASGSADVLEALGVKIDLGPEGVARCIREAGMGFMFAPAFHPAMKYAAPVRRELGIRTVFNVLGPLTNPARARRQLLGVADVRLGPKMADVLRLMGTSHALVVHGHDGVDEVSLSGPTHVWEVRGGSVRSYEVAPEDAGLNRAPLEAIRGGDPATNAGILRKLFSGMTGPLRDVVALNAAAALVVGERAGDLREGVRLAAAALDDGRVARTLETLVKVSQQAAA